jgi:flagellar biosynthesis anti-sigma factor FlgM
MSGSMIPLSQVGMSSSVEDLQQSSSSKVGSNSAVTDTQKGANAGVDAVSLSEGADETAKLVQAAQSSDGIDYNLVAQIKSSIQNSTYSVSPDDLAHAIYNVLKEGN